MTKVCLITDTHWGARGDNLHVIANFKRFYDHVFFPTLDKHNIKNVIHLGDLLDRRKYINFYTAQQMQNIFIKPLVDRQIQTNIIVGNHDVFYKQTNQLNSIQALQLDKNPGVCVHTTAVVEQIGKTKVLLLPWINDDNRQFAEHYLQTAECQYVFGHLEINGFPTHAGAVCDFGYDQNVFGNFNHVFSGHFHLKCTRGNITYLGAPYELSWSECDDPKGFHILDLETGELEFIENPYKLFYKLNYNDLTIPQHSYLKFNPEHLTGTYVKILIEKKARPTVFATFLERIEKANPIDVMVIENVVVLETINAESIDIAETEDTLSALHKSVDLTEGASDPEHIKQILTELYQQALESQN